MSGSIRPPFAMNGGMWVSTRHCEFTRIAGSEPDRKALSPSPDLFRGEEDFPVGIRALGEEPTLTSQSAKTRLCCSS